jgi:lipopolysaccharide/colanic/teichoic acid biosynthesis glycosyltransferase
MRWKMEHKAGFYEKYIKRLLDIIISGAALIILSPLLLIVTVLVRIKLGSPVIFHQQRPGYKEKIFGLCKFRSMTDERDENGELKPDEVRLTSFGRKLRATSLDELPELWNIFKGDMSIIGPRPLLVSYLPYYIGEERLRHSVRPGLTGWAQVNGRNSVDWDRRIALDVEYVKNISFALDVKIFLLTIKKVFVHDGIAVDTSKAEGNFAQIRQERLNAEKGNNL